MEKKKILRTIWRWTSTMCLFLGIGGSIILMFGTLLFQVVGGDVPSAWMISMKAAFALGAIGLLILAPHMWRDFLYQFRQKGWEAAKSIFETLAVLGWFLFWVAGALIPETENIFKTIFGNIGIIGLLVFIGACFCRALTYFLEKLVSLMKKVFN